MLSKQILVSEVKFRVTGDNTEKCLKVNVLDFDNIIDKGKYS